MNLENFLTAHDILQKEVSELKTISIGCRILDEFFRGGIRKGVITEITGEAGTGKTQFSLQLLMESLVSADGNDIDGKGIYVTTQKPVNEKRLEELKYGFISRRFSHLNSEEITAIDEKINNSLIFHKAVTLPEFLAIFHSNFIPEEFKPLRAIVIDSIAAITMECQDFHSKNHFLKKTSMNLRNFADKNQAAVVCVNQVVTRSDLNNNSKLVSALGPLWSIQITERIMLERKRKNDTRYAKIKISPRLKRNRIQFTITTNGVTANLEEIPEEKGQNEELVNEEEVNNAMDQE